MAFGHVGALNDDAVRVLQVARIKGRGASTETGPQTGDAGAVSDAGLVLNGHHPQAAHQLLLEMVPFVVQCRPAQSENGRRVIDGVPSARRSLKVSSRVRFTSAATRLRAHSSVHFVPAVGARLAVQHPGGPVGVDMQLIGRRTLGTESPFAVGAARIALDVDDFAP